MSSSNAKVAKAAQSASSTNKANAKNSDSNEICGFHIPIIRNKDNAKQLPTYYAVLQRSIDDHLAAEDLDNVQLELEKMLSNAALRCRLLRAEIENLDKDERRNERRSKHGSGGGGASNDKAPNSPANNIASSGKRKRDEAAVRKPKHGSTAKHAKYAKNSPVTQHTDDSMDAAAPTASTHLTVHGHAQARDINLPKTALPKNDTPNKFWLSVEPYCMPLTNEDLRLLDDLREKYTGPLVPPIPELGPHYSEIWAVEDLKDVQLASNAGSKIGLKQQNNAANEMLQKADNLLEQNVTGPLTQRLVSALMEEQLLQHTNDLNSTTAGIGESSNSSSENTHSSAQLNFRSLAMLRNCFGIEKRVKQELIEQGILDLNDFPNHDEDEILSEIKRVISELSAVAEYNSGALKRLHDAATEEIKRLEIKRKLDAIDQEILEMYKRTMQNKARRKPHTPEEQQEIYRLTAEQKNLSDQLESLQVNAALFE